MLAMAPSAAAADRPAAGAAAGRPAAMEAAGSGVSAAMKVAG